MTVMSYDTTVNIKKLPQQKSRQILPPVTTATHKHNPSVIHLHHVRVSTVIRIAVVQMSLPTLASSLFL